MELETSRMYPENAPLKIVSWNINGMRASKVSMKNLLDSFEADIICFQETKITRDQIDEENANVDGYNSYFSFSKKRSGYSGVVTFCKDRACPVAAEEGLSGLLCRSAVDAIKSYGSSLETDSEHLHSLDSEGRAVLTKHRVRLKDGRESELTVINVYCPRADPERPERKKFKVSFYRLLQQRAEAILASGSYVIVLGDINTSHKPIDTADPGNCEDFSERPDRKWLDQFLAGSQHGVDNSDEEEFSSGGQFLDSFRYFYPTRTNAFTCWCTTTGARQTNYGSRIDYIFVDRVMGETVLADSAILPDVEGSDHCPIMGTLSCEIIPAEKCPSLCSKYWPEFAGKQVKLSSYLRQCEPKLGNDEAEDKPQKRPLTLPQASAQKPAKGCKTSAKQKSITRFFKANPGNDARKTAATFSVETMLETREEHKRTQNGTSADAWKTLLGGPKPPPLCKGHGEPCVLRVVKKQGPNFRREFYVCARPEGHNSNADASCNFFQWLKTMKVQRKASPVGK